MRNPIIPQPDPSSRLRPVEPRLRAGLSDESRPQTATSRPRDTKPAHAVMSRQSWARRPWKLVFGGPASRQGLIALAVLAALVTPGMARKAQLDLEDIMVQEFQSFCVDYYTPAQCTAAVRFILKTTGSQYFVQLHYDESVDGFLDRIATAVKGGEALKASESLATKTGD